MQVLCRESTVIGVEGLRSRNVEYKLLKMRRDGISSIDENIGGTRAQKRRVRPARLCLVGRHRGISDRFALRRGRGLALFRCHLCKEERNQKGCSRMDEVCVSSKAVSGCGVGRWKEEQIGSLRWAKTTNRDSCRVLAQNLK